MAQNPSNSPAQVTEEAFTADRQRMFAGFTTATMVSTILSAVILILMAIFLL